MLKIYQYWEGPCPEHIQFCMRTVAAHHPKNYVLLGPEDMQEALTYFGIDERWRYHDREKLTEIPLQIKADLLRAHVLAFRGGLWVDTDFMCFAPVFDTLTGYEEKEFAGYFIPDRIVPLIDNDFLYIKGASKFAQSLISDINWCLEHTCKTIPTWAAVGAYPITRTFFGRVFDENLDQKTMLNSRLGLVDARMVTDNRKMVGILDEYMHSSWKPELYRDVEGREACGIMLVNSVSGKYLKEESFAFWRDSSTIIGAYIRLAIERMAGALLL